MSMLIVPDFSHNNIDSPMYKEFVENAADNRALIIKATEGVSYTNPELKYAVESFTDKYVPSGMEKIIGLYHYCRLDNKEKDESVRTRAYKEMVNFIDKIGQVWINNDCEVIPILDWEGANLQCANKDEYLIACTEYILQSTGVSPIIYCSSSVTASAELRALKQIHPDVGLWVAHYQVNTPTIHTWKDWCAWQFTSKPFDISIVKEDSFVGYCVKKVDCL